MSRHVGMPTREDEAEADTQHPHIEGLHSLFIHVCHLSAYVFHCLSASLPPVCLSVCLPIWLSASNLLVCLLSYLIVCLLSAGLFVCLSACRPPVCLSACLPICLSASCPLICLTAFMPVYLLSASMLICLSASCLLIDSSSYLFICLSSACLSSSLSPCLIYYFQLFCNCLPAL